MPAGLEVTVPVPAPALLTVNVGVAGTQLPPTGPPAPVRRQLRVAVQPAVMVNWVPEPPPKATAAIGLPPTYIGAWKELSVAFCEYGPTLEPPKNSCARSTGSA